MYTKCPECRAVFRVTTEQLSMAEGLVRCGICDSVFNGREHIEEDHDPNATSEERQEENKQDFSDDQWPSDGTDDDDVTELEQLADDDTLTNSERIPTVIRDDFGGNILTKTK